MKFTDSKVAQIPLPAGKAEHIEFDDNLPGFGVRVRSGGKRPHRSFIVQYKIGAKQRRISLGNVAKLTLADAFKQARKIFGEVAHGRDPANDRAETRAAASLTLDAIIARYLESITLKPRTLAETERHLEKHWRPLHGLAVASIKRVHVASVLSAIAKSSGPVAANRARATLSAMFRWAIGEGLCDNNPVTGSTKRPENAPRERALSDQEAAKLWLATSDGDYGRIIRLLMLTGCRRDEIGGLKWSEIDVEAQTITIPKERTKNKQEHVVPLSDAAIAIIEAIPRRERDFVFGLADDGGYSGWSRSKKRLDQAAGLQEWRLHDLRRTVRTGLGKLGVQPHVAEAVLNHLPPKLIRTYDRNTYGAEKKAALDLWASHLKVAITQATGGNVTAIRKA
jgi:integrase